jgi:hypothetical protein
MAKTASLHFSLSETILSRVLTVIDHILMTNATIAARNGDLPYFGL